MDPRPHASMPAALDRAAAEGNPTGVLPILGEALRHSRHETTGRRSRADVPLRNCAGVSHLLERPAHGPDSEGGEIE